MGAKTVRALGREATASVVKPAVSLQALQHGLRREVPGRGGAVPGLADGTPPAPVAPTEAGETLAAHGVSGSADQDWRSPGQDQTDRALQLLLNVDIEHQQPAQLQTLGRFFLSGIWLCSFHQLQSGVVWGPSWLSKLL